MSIAVAYIAYFLALAMIIFFWRKIVVSSKKDNDNYFESQKRNSKKIH